MKTRNSQIGGTMKKSLVLYRNMPYENLFHNMQWLIHIVENHEDYDEEYAEDVYYDCVHELIEVAERYGLEGNLWHGYLAFAIANDENAFSTSCEITGPREGSINVMAKRDFAILKELYDFDLKKLDRMFGTSMSAILKDYHNGGHTTKVFNKRIRDRICELSRLLADTTTIDEFYNCVADFYKDFGVGTFGLHKAFRIEHDEKEKPVIVPITCTQHTSLSDIIGYEIQKQKLIENTKNFIEGRPANNCLLFGDSGTGKSSSIKAILNEYYDQGLRMIEIYKHQFQDLSAVVNQIKNRNYRFIIYMDDLSFEEFEIEYKYLKAVIEGGLERRPENVLIYATSNRRHLIKESFNDVDDYNHELHSSDTVQEKLSLAARFGVTIYFGSPNKFEFNKIVSELAKRADLNMDEKELIAEANKWELSHGGLSGRTASQFITYLKGKE